MPIDPGTGEQHAARVLDVIDDLETRLLRMLATSLKAGWDDPDWARRKLAELATIRARATRHVRDADARLDKLIRELVLHAYIDGRALAVADLDDAGLAAEAGQAARLGITTTLAEQALGNIRGGLRIVPQLLSAAYQEAVAAGSLEVLDGSTTRLQASQHVLDRLLSEGVRGFTDRAGRSWSLDTYAEMSVRTVTGQAAVEGHLAQLSDAGIDLVIVSDSPRECPLCRPWEGKILSQGGAIGAVIVPDVTTGEAVTVRVAGTVQEARAAGLQHPNCRHSLSAYLPGATKPVRAKSEPVGYEQVQRQRAMERKVREWKRREQLALTDEAAAKARRKTREWQGALRDHIDQHDLKRLRYREQVGTAGTPLAH